MQIDDAYLGDRAPGKRGKKGRGAANKIPFVIAVETHEGKPAHMQLRRVPGFTQKALEVHGAATEPGAWVISDGLSCFLGVKEAGMKHLAIVTGSGRPTNQLIKWVNTGARQSQ